MNIFTYIFWPRPPALGYEDIKVQTFLFICLFFIVTSFALKHWRKKQPNPITRKLSKSWSSASMWFGIIGLVLTVARAEDISYVSMRFWWLVLGFVAAVYIFLQYKLFRSRHYEKLPSETKQDPREKYLPKKKR
ncbi:MAG: hypothetical protein O2904_01130 [bacterium]|nr:hypothetical protein [bacterium]